jgi:hypothetical protein
MVSLPSLLLGGRWRMDWCVALGLGTINSPNGGYVKEGWLGPGVGWAGRPGPTGLGWPQPSRLPPLPGVSSRVFSILPPSACGPLSSVSLRVGRSSLSRKIRHFSGLVLRVCHLLGFGPWASWSQVCFIAWLVPGFKVLSWGAWWTYPRSHFFSAKTLHKH